MSRYFISYDVETQGLPLWKEPSEHPDQPHIVQIGARLIDIETRQPIETLDAIIEPDGWTIPAEVAAIHGITTERAFVEGIPEHDALAAFDDMWRRAEFRLAYNASFDDRILRIAYMRHVGQERADKWKDGAVKCSARMATPIVNMAPTDRMMAAGRYTAKMPKLAEAYRFFFGKDLENAHSALADVDASTAIYFAIIDRQAAPTPAPAPRPARATVASDELRF